MNKKQKNEQSSFLIYQAKDESIELSFDKKNETIIANVNQVAELFGVQRPAITKHIRKIFADEELNEKVVSSILELSTKHGAIAGKKQIQMRRCLKSF